MFVPGEELNPALLADLDKELTPGGDLGLSDLADAAREILRVQGEDLLAARADVPALPWISASVTASIMSQGNQWPTRRPELNSPGRRARRRAGYAFSLSCEPPSR